MSSTTRIAFVIALAACGPPQYPNTQPSIGPGNWKIDHAAGYRFDYKPIGGYRFGPKLIVGSNGVMLVAQAMGAGAGSAPLMGSDVTATISITGGGSLKNLQAPDPGPWMTVLDTPLTTWYFGPLPTGATIETLTLQYQQTSEAWPFGSASKIAGM